VLVFAQTSYPVLFLIYPPLVFVVVLFGVAGGALSLFLVTAISMVFTVYGHGPMLLMQGATERERIIMLQIFAMVAAVMVLMLAAVLAERDRVKQALAQASEALGHLAATDGLTGLANRRRFDEAVELALRRAVLDGNHVSLLLLDVDNFKSYNDANGHLAGDECLRRLGAAIKKLARPSDLCARYGGEELAILLSPARQPVAVTVAERLRGEIEGFGWPHPGNAGHGVVTVSIGIATYKPGSAITSPNELIAEADAMLYEAKRRGRNKIMSRAMMEKYSAA
jgi:diguanylate cyclase (GGDEF)-like protein